MLWVGHHHPQADHQSSSSRIQHRILCKAHSESWYWSTTTSTFKFYRYSPAKCSVIQVYCTFLHIYLVYAAQHHNLTIHHSPSRKLHWNIPFQFFEATSYTIWFHHCIPHHQTTFTYSTLDPTISIYFSLISHNLASIQNYHDSPLLLTKFDKLLLQNSYHHS